MAEPATDWHAARRLGLGGSDMGALFSDKPYGCARRLMYEKLAAPPDFPEEAAARERDLTIRGGKIGERFVADDYGEQTARVLLTCPEPFVHPTVPYVRANIDREIAPVYDHDGPGVLEVKTHLYWLYRKVEVGGLQDAHIRQLQWGLYASGRTWGAYAIAERESVLVNALERLAGEASPAPIDMKAFDVARDDDLIGQLDERAREFWALREAGDLPDPLPELRDDRCRSCAWRYTCRGRHNLGAPAPSEARAELEDFDSPELQNAIGEYLIAKAELEAADDKVDRAKAAVIDALAYRDDEGKICTTDDGELLYRTGVRADGATIHYRTVSRTSWDTKALEVLPPLLKPTGATTGADAVAAIRAAGLTVDVVDLRQLYRRTSPTGGGRPLKIYVK